MSSFSFSIIFSTFIPKAHTPYERASQEFAKLIRKDKTTLLRWHKEGKLIPYRIEGNNRYYSLQQLKDIRGEAFYEREVMDREELLGLIDELEKRIYFLETNYKKAMEEIDNRINKMKYERNK